MKRFSDLIGREFRTRAGRLGTALVSRWESEDMGGAGQQWSSVQALAMWKMNALWQKRKATEDWAAIGMAAWACPVASFTVGVGTEQLLCSNASWRNRGVRDMLLKATEAAQFPIQNDSFEWPCSEVSNAPCGEDLLCQCYPYEKKNWICWGFKPTVLSDFFGNMLFSSLIFFLSRNILYQKARTNGPSRCLGQLGARLFICVGLLGLVQCVSHKSCTP